jgi:hypothetical protein
LQALEKGFVGNRSSSTGVKMLENGVIELKIWADSRLYADKISNSQGKYLLIQPKMSLNREFLIWKERWKG